jgi:ABC-type nickel/cobalt efflux system permease component RcnA
VAHTAGVFMLGIVTLSLSSRVVPEKLYPIIQLVSGVAIAVLGVRMFATRLREGWQIHSHGPTRGAGYLEGVAPSAPGRGGGAHGHVHAHGHRHDHGHSHGHRHDHGHSHDVPAGAPTLATLLALGVSGGILPCPSALVVLSGGRAAPRRRRQC